VFRGVLSQLVICLMYFFSSRRRHTRSTRDWSSDVCSSDLVELDRRFDRRRAAVGLSARRPRADDRSGDRAPRRRGYGCARPIREIGRASCRERGSVPQRAITARFRGPSFSIGVSPVPALLRGLFVVLMLTAPVLAGQTLPKTTAERSNYASTSGNDEVGAFLDSLELAGAPIAVSELGRTALGKPIFFVIASDPPVTSPGEAAAAGKLVVYLQANIHAGEVE